MTIRHDNDDAPFLSRWSRLKREQAQQEEAKEKAGTPQAATKEHAQPPHSPAVAPAVEQLTPEADFSAFMGPKVQDAVRRVALKKLFSDPHFNVPDPFEPFSGDWTGEPISEEMLKTLNQARTHLFPEQKKREEAQEQERLAAEAAAAAPEDGAGERAATNDTLEEKHDEPGRQDA